MRSHNHASPAVSDHGTSDQREANRLYLESDAEAPKVSGWIDHASWLSDDVLLLTGWFHAESDSVRASVTSEDEVIAVDTRCISFFRYDLAEVDPLAGKVLTVRFPDPKKARGCLGKMVIQTDDTPLSLGPLDLSQAMNDLEGLIRAGLVWWETGTRNEVMAFLVGALGEYPDTVNGLRLCKSLGTVRQWLREQLPPCAISLDNPQGLSVDAILALDEKSFYVRGWARDEESEITELIAVSPEGSRVDLLDRIFRYSRPDVEQFYGLSAEEQSSRKTGFISYLEIEERSRLPVGWVLEMRTGAGVALEATAPRVVQDTLTVRNTVLGDLSHERLPNVQLLTNHVFPAVSRVQLKVQDMVEVEDLVQFGTNSESPEISVIVPLYQRIDFLEQQLAQFVHDPEFSKTELIYILDSPALANELTDTAAKLFRLYGLPFSVAVLKRNVGFSAVNNVGASLARGQLLLLLNSDVLPDRPGWLGKMSEFYKATPGIGALGPKLLYEDDSLQHAGMYFIKPMGASLWENMHYLKGFHRNLESANIPRPVPAVSGACLMVDKDIYEQIGGLQGEYVQGDYEDSDLGLRLLEEGYENWYLPDAELYHLEGQSYAPELRQLNTRYNTWLQSHRWGEQIESIMKRYASPASRDAAAVYPGVPVADGSGGEHARGSLGAREAKQRRVDDLSGDTSTGGKQSASRASQQRGKPKSGQKVRGSKGE